MLLSGPRSYFNDYVRKNGIGRALNDPPTLLTDRGAYVNFLEVQLERVSAGCLSVQQYDEKFNDIFSQVVGLEQRCANTAKLVNIAQQCTLELRAENDQKLQVVQDNVKSEYYEMQKLIQAMSARITASEQILATIPGIQARIDSLETKLIQNDIKFELFEAKFKDKLSTDEANLQDIKDTHRQIKNDLAAFSTSTSKNTFDIEELDRKSKRSIVSLEDKFMESMNSKNDNLVHKVESSNSQFNFQLERMQADIVSRESGCLSALRLFKESIGEELNILNSSTNRKIESVEQNHEKQVVSMANGISSRIDHMDHTINSMNNKVAILSSDYHEHKNDVNSREIDTDAKFDDLNSDVNDVCSKIQEALHRIQDAELKVQEHNKNVAESNHHIAVLRKVLEESRDFGGLHYRLTGRQLSDSDSHHKDRKGVQEDSGHSKIPLHYREDHAKHHRNDEMKTNSREHRRGTSADRVSRSLDDLSIPSSKASRHSRLTVDDLSKTSSIPSRSARFKEDGSDKHKKENGPSDRYHNYSSNVHSHHDTVTSLRSRNHTESDSDVIISNKNNYQTEKKLNASPERKAPSVPVRHKHSGKAEDNDPKTSINREGAVVIDYIGAGLYGASRSLKPQVKAFPLAEEPQVPTITETPSKEALSPQKAVSFTPVLRSGSPPADKSRLGYIGAGLYWDKSQPVDKHLLLELLDEMKDNDSVDSYEYRELRNSVKTPLKNAEAYYHPEGNTPSSDQENTVISKSEDIPLVETKYAETEKLLNKPENCDIIEVNKEQNHGVILNSRRIKNTKVKYDYDLTAAQTENTDNNQKINVPSEIWNNFKNQLDLGSMKYSTDARSLPQNIKTSTDFSTNDESSNVRTEALLNAQEIKQLDASFLFKMEDVIESRTLDTRSNDFEISSDIFYHGNKSKNNLLNVQLIPGTNIEVRQIEPESLISLSSNRSKSSISEHLDTETVGSRSRQSADFIESHTGSDSESVSASDAEEDRDTVSRTDTYSETGTATDSFSVVERRPNVADNNKQIKRTTKTRSKVVSAPIRSISPHLLQKPDNFYDCDILMNMAKSASTAPHNISNRVGTPWIPGSKLIPDKRETQSTSLSNSSKSRSKSQESLVESVNEKSDIDSRSTTSSADMTQTELPLFTVPYFRGSNDLYKSRRHFHRK